MRTLAVAASIATMSVCVLAVTAWTAGAARADEPRALATKITAVTVYADRARVTRSGAVALSSTAKRVVVKNLPGWIDEESVRATLKPAGGGRILDVTVERAFLAEASEEAVRAADAKVFEAQDRMAALQDEQAVLQAEVKQLEAIRAFSLDKLPRDMATREVKVTAFGDTVAFVTERLRKNRAALREVGKARRALQPELQALARARDELRARAQLEQRHVVIEVEGRGTATLDLTYLTPGAAWEPVSELRATAAGGKVDLAQLAVVVQTTGEDWDGADLVFSTQRPADTLAVPEVQALVLGDAGSSLGEAMGRMGQSFQRAQSAYAVQNPLANQGNFQFQANLARQQAIQSRSAARFSSLAKRGTTAHFEALSRRPVRADGKPIRVAIAAAAFDIRPRLVAVPEASLNAVRTAEIVHTGDQPILPGKVALFVDGAFVGHSELPFVAPGETFSTYLGVHERVKLARTLDRKRSKLDRGKKKTEVKASFVISAENLGDQPVTLELGDRVPVASIDAIEVDDIKLPKGSKRDSNGIVRWTVTLPPRMTQAWRISYKLEYPTNLLTKATEKQKRADQPSRMLYESIETLEDLL